MNNINKVMDKEIEDIDLNKYTDYYVRFCIRQQNNFENCPLDNQIILQAFKIIAFSDLTIKETR